MSPVWSFDVVHFIVDQGRAAEGVVLIDAADNRDVTTVRNVEGDPTVGVGIRLVRSGAAPLTVHVDAGAVGSVVVVSTTGDEGTTTGTCVRGPDQPVR